MPFELRLPHLHSAMSGATIECVYAACNTRLQSGSKIFDISIDLGSALAQECPPISYYRLVLRETLWLRRLDASPGLLWDPNMPLAIFTTHPDESLADSITRPVRIATAGIIYHDGMWSGSAR